MKKIISLTILFALSLRSCLFANDPSRSQSRAASAEPFTASPQVQQRQPASFELSEYGVTFQIEPRLIIMMAALEAAGFRSDSCRCGTFRLSGASQERPRRS